MPLRTRHHRFVDTWRQKSCKHCIFLGESEEWRLRCCRLFTQSRQLGNIGISKNGNPVYSVKDMHCRWALVFLLSPIEWVRQLEQYRCRFFLLFCFSLVKFVWVKLAKRNIFFQNTKKLELEKDWSCSWKIYQMQRNAKKPRWVLEIRSKYVLFFFPYPKSGAFCLC